MFLGQSAADRDLRCSKHRLRGLRPQGLVSGPLSLLLCGELFMCGAVWSPCYLIIDGCCLVLQTFMDDACVSVRSLFVKGAASLCVGDAGQYRCRRA